MKTLDTEYKILAIDTSCDETSVAVTSGIEVLSNERYSQVQEHATFGGVVPGMAKFLHAEKIDGLVDMAIQNSKLSYADLDAIAVTQGPGLAIALEVGISKAKSLAIENSLPLVAVNHMEGHLISGLAELGEGIEAVNFPAVGILVSGKHTEFIVVSDYGEYQKVGLAIDDAAGEAFDKCGRMLGLPYPAGPHISRLAEEYRSNLEIKFERDQQKLYARGYRDDQLQYELPVPMAYSDNSDMSYSGLKTAFKNLLRKQGSSEVNLNYAPGQELVAEHAPEVVGELSLMFESAALKALMLKLEKVVNENDCHELWLGGGVVASKRLRFLVGQFASSRNLTIREPRSMDLMVDNAAMIGIAANLVMNDPTREEQVLKGGALSILDRKPSLSL